VDINQAFRYVFDDERWTNKILIGVLMSLLSFLILPALILNGWLVQIVRNVMGGDKRPLAEWDDWGKLLKDGFYLFVAQLVYTLPFLIIFFIALASSFGISGLSGELGEEAASAGFMATFGLLGCVSIIFAIALLFLTPALTIQYAMTDDLGACFRFSEVFAIARENMADIFIAFVVTLVAAFAISLAFGVLSIIPCLGWIAAFVLGLALGPYLVAVTGHLYGQIGSKVQGPGKMAVVEG
jgi:hypothetical protein